MVPSSAIILLLPDEILIEILSRVPLDDLTSIPFVCRRFSNLLVNNPDFLRHRLIPSLHVFGLNPDGDDGVSFISVSVPLNTSNWSVPIRQPLPCDRGCDLVSLGRCVYLFGYEVVFQVAFRHDTWTKTTVPVACPPSSSYHGKSVSAINGKLYACTSLYGTTDINEYDPGADEWRVVASSHVDGLDNAHSFVGVGAGGVFYLLSHDGFTKGYDFTAGKWVGNMPGPLPALVPYCSACGTPNGHLYVISSSVEEEARFWRWEGSGEEWIELEPPVVPPTPGYIGRRYLWFSCVAVRNERVVAMVNVRHIDIIGSCFTGKYILVYSVVDGSWSRGPDLPFKFQSRLGLAFTEY